MWGQDERKGRHVRTQPFIWSSPTAPGGPWIGCHQQLSGPYFLHFKRLCLLPWCPPYLVLPPPIYIYAMPFPILSWVLISWCTFSEMPLALWGWPDSGCELIGSYVLPLSFLSLPHSPLSVGYFCWFLDCKLLKVSACLMLPVNHHHQHHHHRENERSMNAERA